MAFTVTDEAKAELKRTLETGNFPEGRFLKLAVKPEWSGPGDFGIVNDVEKGGEVFFEHEGMVVLAVDPGLVENLEKSVFDFKTTPQGMGFTLDVY